MTEPNGRGAPRFVLALLLAVLLVGAGGAGYALALHRHQPPATDSADAGFARDMAVHHAQAVLMASIVRDASTDPKIRYLAYDILTSQQGQLGMMQGWLSDWGLPARDSSQPPMAWMHSAPGGHAGHGGGQAAGLQPGERMPGMATQAEIDRLRSLRGRPAEVLFLRLMITHHEAGVDMARAGVARVHRPAVRRLAGAIAESQAAEVQAMQDLLRERGA
ncbi:MAG: hypothetical protein JWN87_433 [Frankiales bacterium]|nr:hypothetical protein [Frankiales bacterium]